MEISISLGFPTNTIVVIILGMIGVGAAFWFTLSHLLRHTAHQADVALVRGSGVVCLAACLCGRCHPSTGRGRRAIAGAHHLLRQTVLAAGGTGELHLFAGQPHQFDAGKSFLESTQQEAALFFRRTVCEPEVIEQEVREAIGALAMQTQLPADQALRYMQYPTA